EEPTAQKSARGGPVDARRIHAGRNDGLDFRREHDLLAVGPLVERLDAETIARGHQAPARPVVDHERPHAVETADAIEPPLVVGAQEHFGVAARAEAITVLNELFAELEVVVDLAIEDDRQ